MIYRLAMYVLAMSWGAALGLAGGVWYAVPSQPIPVFAPLDCYQITDEFEPWHVYPDGQVLLVGHTRYLAVSRQQRNSNDRYNGYKTYGFEIDMATAHEKWTRLPCPKAWLK